ncbi:hypothetical protein [Mesorhizobium hawassense]|uniref:hypothetical protein n=1 Tax=Mesorhizobium hawassense TaxID=1209954 RepID=UPI00142E5089|nr:hypothetical protein [Mesorhizobium hawassense]
MASSIVDPPFRLSRRPMLDPIGEFDGAVVRFYDSRHKPTEPAIWPPFSNASAQRLASRAARHAIQCARKVAKDGHSASAEIANDARSYFGMNVSRSVFSRPWRVVAMPCGAPGDRLYPQVVDEDYLIFLAARRGHITAGCANTKESILIHPIHP